MASRNGDYDIDADLAALLRQQSPSDQSNQQQRQQTGLRPNYGRRTSVAMIVILCLFGTAGLAAIVWLWLSRSSNSGGTSGGGGSGGDGGSGGGGGSGGIVTPLPSEFLNVKVSGVDAKVSGMVTLANPFVSSPAVPWSTNIAIPSVDGWNDTTSVESPNFQNERIAKPGINCAECRNLQFVASDPMSSMSLGNVFTPACSCSTGPPGFVSLDSNKAPNGISHSVAKSQIQDWVTWTQDKLVALFSLNNRATFMRPKISVSGWVELGDFVYGTAAPNVEYASVPLFWTLQGSPSSGSMITCSSPQFKTSDGFIVILGDLLHSNFANIAAYGGLMVLNDSNNLYAGSHRIPSGFDQRSTTSIWYTRPLWDTTSTLAQRAIPVSGYSTKDVQPVDGWFGLLRTAVGLPSPKATDPASVRTYNLLTRYARQGDITVQTVKLVFVSSTIKLGEILGDYGFGDDDIPYLQALNSQDPGSVLYKSTRTSWSAAMTAVPKPNTYMIVAPFPLGYTKP